MAFYLLQEDGSKLYLEDLSGFLLLEDEPVPGPTVYYQGGAGHPAKHTGKRSRTHDLFDRLEATLRQTLAGDAHPPAPVVVRGGALVLDPEPDYTGAVQQLAALAGRYQNLTQRVAGLREAITALSQERHALEEDDEELWLLV